jgi:hypothetical protein
VVAQQHAFNYRDMTYTYHPSVSFWFLVISVSHPTSFLYCPHLNTLILPIMYPVMSDPNNSVLYQVSVPMNSSGFTSSDSGAASGIHFGDVLSQIWSLITIGRLLVLLLVVGNLKNVPLIWHVRISLTQFLVMTPLMIYSSGS